jgi:hypothetical protein
LVVLKSNGANGSQSDVLRRTYSKAIESKL